MLSLLTASSIHAYNETVKIDNNVSIESTSTRYDNNAMLNRYVRQIASYKSITENNSYCETVYSGISYNYKYYFNSSIIIPVNTIRYYNKSTGDIKYVYNVNRRITSNSPCSDDVNSMIDRMHPLLAYLNKKGFW